MPDKLRFNRGVLDVNIPYLPIFGQIYKDVEIPYSVGRPIVVIKVECGRSASDKW